MQTEKGFRQTQWNAIGLILAVAAVSILYRLIMWRKLEQTSLLFVGIPTVLAILLTLTSKSKTVKGSIAKGITLALLMSGPLLGEGFICIVMAAPIFYAVGLAAGAAVDAQNKKRNTTLTCLVLFLIPMSFEGTSPQLSWNREETVSVAEIVSANANAVEQALSQSPRTDLPLPYYLRLGFPRPTQAQGSGLEVGSTRRIHFAGGEGQPGDLVMKVEESRSGYVRFATVADHSKIAHWLDWKTTEVTWQALDAQHTRVMWTLSFRRRLDPAWYFALWERYGVRLAAEYLIQANATPLQAGRGR
jgi:hypothetical protein